MWLIDDLLSMVQSAVGFIWTNQEPWVKSCIALAMFAIVSAFVLIPMFDLLHINHRIFQPAECSDASKFLNSQFSSIIDCPGALNSPELIQQWITLNNCVTNASGGTCGDCILMKGTMIGLISSSDNNTCHLSCYVKPTPFLHLPGSPSDECVFNKFITPEGLNESYYEYCGMKASTPYAIALRVYEGCATKGIDFLNPALYIILTLSIPLGKIMMWIFTASGIMKPPFAR